MHGKRGLVVLGLLGVLAAETQAAGGPSTAEPPEASLPLTAVKLYTSGVGYFERTGPIDGMGTVTIPVTAAQLNDVLKSLVVQDSQGGRVSIVSYASRDPLAKALGGFGVDLSQNQSMTQILIQLRGERVKLATPQEVEGAIVSVETRQEAGGKETLVPVDYVNLVTDQGFRAVAIPQIHAFSILNPRLAGEVQQALAVLATRHDTQKAPLSIRFEGTGQRRARVAYLMETPVWKTAYRLVLDPDKKPWLQGWALVDNPTDQDWTNIRLSLLSGRPISFTMNLADPLYAQRPHVLPELQAAVRPQTHDMELATVSAPEKAAQHESKLRRNERAKAEGRMFGGMVAAEAPPGAPPAEETLQSVGESLVPATRADEVGSLFQYEIDQVLTIARHQAAMVPILNTAIDGELVAVYNRATHAKHPLNGFRLRNSSPLHLMQGPITVFNGGAYAGDARLLDLAPGQDRLITYALDLNTEVEPRAGAGTQDLQSIVVKKGTLVATRRWAEQVTYTVKNRDRRGTTVLIEHPFRPDWKLSDDTLHPERTRDVYRFSVSVKPNESATLVVREERPLQETVVLTDVGLNQLAVYLQAPNVSGKAKEALQQLAALRGKLSDIQAQRGQQEQLIRDIEAEQQRIRENMQRLDQRSDLYGRYVKKLDAQETDVERFRKSLADLRKAEEEQRRLVQAFINGLDLS